MALATWQGPFDAEVYGPSGKTRLNIGDTYEVGEQELQSAHWKRVRVSRSTPAEPAPETANAPDGGTD